MMYGRVWFSSIGGGGTKSIQGIISYIIFTSVTTLTSTFLSNTLLPLFLFFSFFYLFFFFYFILRFLSFFFFSFSFSSSIYWADTRDVRTQVQATNNYKAADTDELSLEAGDVIYVLPIENIDLEVNG